MNLFKDCSSYAKPQAQQNLTGRTFYCSDDSLRFHHSRILRTTITDGGLLLGIVESCSADMGNTKRGFRPVVFDIFGTVVNNRAKISDLYSTRKAAEKAMWRDINAIDAKAHTLAAIDRAEKYALQEYADMRAKLAPMGEKAQS